MGPVVRQLLNKHEIMAKNDARQAARMDKRLNDIHKSFTLIEEALRLWLIEKKKNSKNDVTTNGVKRKSTSKMSKL